MGSDNFCLRWNDFESNVSGSFRALRDDEDFFDVTLVADHKHFRAHKVILSACSTFFKRMLRKAGSHPSPMIYLRGIGYQDMSSILDFMYNGEVNVAQDELNSFLAVAEDLQIKGLTQKGEDTTNASSTTTSTATTTTSATSNTTTTMTSSNRKIGSKAKLISPSSTLTSMKKIPRIEQQPKTEEDIEEIIDVKADPDLTSVVMDPTTGNDGVSGGGGGGGGGGSSGGGGGSGGGSDEGDNNVGHNTEEELNEEHYDDTFTDDGTYYDEAALIDVDEGTAAISSEVRDNTKGRRGKYISPEDDEALPPGWEELILSHMTKVDRLWTCKSCGSQSRDKTDMRRHVEAKHVNHAGYHCPLCNYVSKTRRNLVKHKKKKHFA